MLIDKPMRVTRGNDTLSRGDIVFISGVDGSLVICPLKEGKEFIQGGWIDKDDMERYPELMDFEWEDVSDKYEIINHFGGEAIVEITL